MPLDSAKAAIQKANAATQTAQTSRIYADHIAAAWAHDAAMKTIGKCLTKKTTYRQELEIQAARGHHQTMADWHWIKAATAKRR